MASIETALPAHVLVVSDLSDDSLRACLDALRLAAGSVELVPDVYAAMAKLAIDDHVSRVVLDVRTLDERELVFPRVMARYHASVQVLVPALDGTAARLERSAAGLRATDVQQIAAGIVEEQLASVSAPQAPEMETEPGPGIPDQPGRPEQVAPGEPTGPAGETGVEVQPAAAADPIVAEPPAPSASPSEGTRVLSTDGGAGSLPPGPSLHDAVRARMAGDDPRHVARRTPPRLIHSPPMPPPVQEGSGGQEHEAQPDDPAHTSGPSTPERPPRPPAPDRQSLSPEEVDALLGGEPNDPSPPAESDESEAGGAT